VTSLIVLTLAWAATILIGYVLTMARTPRALILKPPRSLVVRPWSGASRVILLGPDSYFVSLEYHGEGFLGSLPCELIEIRTKPASSTRLLIEYGLLDEVLRRGPPRKRPKGPPTGRDADAPAEDR
jgi:hypothetical protein